MWPPLSDESLLAGFGARDPDASAAFVRRFQSRLYGLALTILADRGEAEEAAQEAFLRAWRHAEAYDPRRGSVATWLLAIVRNVAIDRARMRRSEPVDPSNLLADAVDPARSPEERRIAGEEAERLPLEQRRALLLAVYLGRTAREIGALDGTPIGTVKTRIRTAALRLHAKLEVGDA